ncbi:monovalent cation/H(+) antiporter subunit G [Falsirhodobacter deserti]|uniref:monovalent cation/H(+) antiporter subunit G n=1 Tax=Falsirhodobacter deserti TaxID=1365611 RepID=UPI000FE414F6|nr:monovalent cation/H(+) antiporter subunit G [Falsirhodobacter deserti]
MTDLPIWAAIVVGLLLIAGGTFALIGAIGLLRLDDFYRRLHAPSLSASGATTCIVLASIIGFSVMNGRPVLREILVGFFIMCTAPVTLMLLGRVALYRDRAADRPVVAESDPLGASPDQE